MAEDLRPAPPDGIPTKSVSKDDIFNARLDKLVASVETLATRFDGLDAWRAEVDLRATRNSARVSQVNQVDLLHEAQLAREKAAREDLAKKVDMLDLKTDAQTVLLKKLLEFTEKPVIKLICTAIGAAALSWLAAKGYR